METKDQSGKPGKLATENYKKRGYFKQIGALCTYFLCIFKEKKPFGHILRWAAFKN